MTAPTLRRAAAGLVAGGCLLLVAACGSDSDTTASDPESSATTSAAASDSAEATPSDSATPSAPAFDGPACAEVWVTGKKLAADYAGCASETGELVKVHKVPCSSGQAFVLYGDRYWAVRGGTIKYAAKGWARSKEYIADISACRG